MSFLFSTAELNLHCACRGHGIKEVCGYRGLTPGKKHVVLWGFNGGGPYYNDMYYSGPDTMDTTRYPISVQAGPSMDGVTTKLAASSVQTLAMEHSDKDETSCSPPTTECLRLGVMDNLCGDCLDLGGGDFKLKNSKVISHRMAGRGCCLCLARRESKAQLHGCNGHCLGLRAF